MALEVAPEIWLEIAYILPPPALANLSLANHRFRELSKAPLFAHFEFHPYALALTAHSIKQALLPEPENFQKFSERLEFWCSDAIAPHVRTCVVSPWLDGHGITRDWRFSASPTPFVLLEAFVRNLGRFKQLRELTLHRVDFQYTTLIASYSALNLGSLQLDHCNVFPAADIAVGDNKLKVKRFSLEDNPGDETALALWLAGFDRNALEELELQYCMPTWHRSKLVIEPSGFPNVRILSLRLRNVCIKEDLRFLAYFPALTNLSIHDWEPPRSKDLDRPLPVELYFLKLKTLHASSELLPLFLNRKASPSLEKLSVICAPSSLVSALRTIPTESFSRTISSLVLSIYLTGDRPPHVESDSTSRYLGEILEFFPRLQKLRMNFPDVDGEDGDDPIPLDYFVSLATLVSLPPSLTALFITWELVYEHLGNPPGDDATEDQLVKLKDALLERCPALESLWLDGNSFTYRWEAGFEDEDGRFDEDEDDMNILREELYWSPGVAMLK
ncbi:hypothetical protein C8F01DRAFT_1308506 [Mycena amicta]|nr:hypothetical protein C8F01DRAFT_1308506 [Mycena amicta]